MSRGYLITLAGLFSLLIAAHARGQGSHAPLREIRTTTESSRATVRVHLAEKAAYRIPQYITGKFAEHLGANIYNGMDAQILRNPTFADYPFSNGQMSPDGIVHFHSEEEKISEEIRRQAGRWGWPAQDLDALVTARTDGMACWWSREGAREAVQVSPDTGPHGGRAQRVQVRDAGQGIAQWTYLPLHRVRRYEFEIFARSPNLQTLEVALWNAEEKKPVAISTVKGLSTTWRKLQGTLEMRNDVPAESVYRFTLTANSPAQFVLGRVLLRPADHIHGADPDIVRLLKQSHLPILRWPGGNFVSGYHWEEGVGLIEARPTRPNYAWGGVEPNLFGTDEFIEFCRAVGCEPMICINAGNGTPEEAARWIEYCNGSPRSTTGARRAANGHREPYHIRHWEIGNELWGHWQYHWTTATGYVDRYEQFARAMRTADSKINLYACGAPVLWGKEWNDTLIGGAASQMKAITDHPLIGGQVASSVEPLDVYRDFMAIPEVLESKWAELQRQMIKAGIEQPRLAVTELQMFAHLGRTNPADEAVRLTRENLVNPGTHAEGLYDVLIYHAGVRLLPFVEMVTHSAIVNHGGGLRKERERVYANPCHYAQAAFAEFAGATPVRVELESAMEQAPLVLPELKSAVHEAPFSAVDALAALTSQGNLLLSLVHRGSRGPIHLTIALDDFKTARAAELVTLTAPHPWTVNSLANPQAVSPAESRADLKDNTLELDLPPYTFTRVRIPR